MIASMIVDRDKEKIMENVNFAQSILVQDVNLIYLCVKFAKVDFSKKKIAVFRIAESVII